MGAANVHNDLGTMVKVASLTMGCFALLELLDIGMMIVSIMAYTGAQSEDDSAIIQSTYITFFKGARSIQILEIILTCSGLIFNATLGTMLVIRVNRLRQQYTYNNGMKLQRLMLLFLPIWVFINFALWLICVVYQSWYVPMLGTSRLPECVVFGSELTQCGMVDASWILAMIFCALYAVVIVSNFTAYYHLQFPEAVYGERIWRSGRRWRV